MSIALRPRSGVEIIDAAFQLWRSHYAQFCVLSLVACAPLFLLHVVADVNSQPFAALTAQLLSLFCNALAEASIVVAVSDIYLGGTVNVRRALEQTMPRVWRVISASWLRGFYVLLGFLMLIVPGFLFLAQSFATTAVVVLEPLPYAREALARSITLSKGMRWKILITLGLSWLLVFLLAVSARVGIADFSFDPRVDNLFTQIVFALLLPLPAVVATLLYYDARTRHEAFDLELMAQQLPPAPEAHPV